MKIKIKGESDKYRKQRERLLKAEIDLKNQREKVAQLRRKLPMGALVKEDYIFKEGPKDLSKNSSSDFFDTPLSTLFRPRKTSLIVIHLMFAPDSKTACPMCTMWADGYNAVSPHLLDKVNFVLVGKAELSKLRKWARSRCWDKIKILSSYSTTFNKDFNVEDKNGDQRPAVSVFKKTENGKIHHFYTTEASLGPGHHRGIDLFTPVWNLFDLLPEGRENWFPDFAY